MDSGGPKEPLLDMVQIFHVKGQFGGGKGRSIVNENLSDWITLNGGMPQGTWLGPLSFIAFINDKCKKTVVL